MSYKKMKEEEVRLEAEIKEMLQKAVSVDEEEDRRYEKPGRLWKLRPGRRLSRRTASPGRKIEM